MVIKLRKNLFVLGTAIGLIRPRNSAEPVTPKIEYRNLNSDLTKE